MKTFLLLLLCCPVFVFSQPDTLHSSQKRTLVLGLQFSGLTGYLEDPVTQEEYRISTFRWLPHLSVYFKNVVGIGIVGERATFKESFGKRPDRWGYGTYLRYYPYFKIKDKSFFKYLSPYIEAGYHRANYIVLENWDFRVTERIDNQQIKAIIGLQIRPWKGIALDYGLQYINYLTNETDGLSKDIIGRIALEYHF